MTYSNVNDFIVIQADDRNADVSWQHHRERGSYGGVDCVAPLWTPIYAPDDCILVNYPNNGSGGNTIELRYMDGVWVDQMMHLAGFVNSGFVPKDGLVGFSGDTGSPGQPHVHWHRIGPWYRDGYGDTNRYNPWHYFASDTAGEVGEEIEIPIEIEEDEEMHIIIVQPEDSQLAKYILDTKTGRKRVISKGENAAYRKLNSDTVTYVTLSDSDLATIPNG